MSNTFLAKKQKILSQLEVPETEYTDASPRGSVDEEIRELVSLINSTEGFVTTSSCSGRIAVFVDGPSKVANTLLEGSGDRPLATSAGPAASDPSIKGGGYWLFTSHKPIQQKLYERPGSLFELLGFQSDAKTSFQHESGHPRYIHFKFEPMILHMLADSPKTAQIALSAATIAGFRESGISGLYDSKDRETTPMVAIRGSSFRFDSIIGYLDDSRGEQQMSTMVSESYLRTLVKVANERFQINAERTERFRSALIKHTSSSISSSDAEEGAPEGFEPAALRAVRKRREGLARREALQSSTSNNVDLSGRVEDIDLNLLNIPDSNSIYDREDT